MRKNLLRVVALLVASCLITVSVSAQPKKPTKGKTATKLPPGLTLARVKAHVIAPAHTKNKRTEHRFVHDASFAFPAVLKKAMKVPTVPKKDPGPKKGVKVGARGPTQHLD